MRSKSSFIFLLAAVPSDRYDWQSARSLIQRQGLTMRLASLFSSLLCAALASPSIAQQPWPPSPHVASTPPLTPAEQRKKFHLPPGFEIELVAAEPQINKPINIAFDAKGRLWVTGSVEYPFPAKNGQTPRDKV